MKQRIALLLILAALPLAAKQIPYFLNELKTPNDIGALNSNFQSIETDLRRLESQVLLERDTCEQDTPARIGQLCFDTTDYKLYVATQVIKNGFQIIGQQ